MLVTVEQDANPPRVRIETTEPDVYRTIGTDTVRVRGVVEAGTVYDYELPQSMDATYSDGLEVSDPVQMPDVGCWLIHPGDPSLSLLVDFATHPSWTRPAVTSTLDIPGGGTSAATFKRGSARGTFSLNVYDEGPMVDLLADGSVLFLSTPLYALGSVYVALGDAGWNRSVNYWPEGERVLSLPYVEVDRPAFVASSTVTIGSLTGTIGSLSGTIADLGG